MIRYTEAELKARGFTRFNSTNAYVRDDAIVSYGLPVALRVDGKWTSAAGLHDYSPSTTKQVYQITGDLVGYRRKEWNIIGLIEFRELVERIMRGYKGDVNNDY